LTQDLPEKLNLGCGEDIRPGFHNVDVVDAARIDETVDLEEMPWPWPDDCFETILASHVLEHIEDLEGALREISRILVSGGTAEIRWPIGLNEVADPDHVHQWGWRTPEFYCGERHWDVDVGLSVVERDCDLWSLYPAGLLRRWHETWLSIKLSRYGSGPWCFTEPRASGEFRAVMQA